MKNKEENKIKYNTLRIIRQLPREGELWRTEGGEEDGGRVHSGIFAAAGEHGDDAGKLR